MIKRSRWARGNDGLHGASLFTTGDKKMCCLGFYLRSCGLKINDIRDKPTPYKVGKIPEEASWLINRRKVDSKATTDLIEANDADKFNRKYNTPETREARIKELFAKQNVKVEFVP